jgi:hypothetical protein
MMPRGIPSALAVVLAVSSAWAQVPPRDTPRNPAAGTATIAGIVVSDEQQPRPLRRTRVMLNGSTLPVGRTVITNDDGSFAFERVPAGRYTLGAMREGYVPMQHGATRFGRPGALLVVRDGESQRVTLKLPRGSVITGTVTSTDGQPIPGVSVVAMREEFVPTSGERRLAPFGMVIPVTDDRGIYRIHGLPAGDYLVSASLRNSGAMSGELHIVTDSEVRRALSEVKSPSSASGRTPGSSAAAPSPGARRVAYAPVFFPNAPSASQATVVTVGKGEERTGIDIQLQPFGTARVEGIVHGLRAGGANVGLAAPQIPGAMMPGTFRAQRRVEPDGRFSIPAVPPGRYTVVATSWLPPEKQGAMPKVFSATTDINVDGEDISNVMLTLNAGITIAGRVVFEGTQPPVMDLSQLSVNVPIALTGVGISLPVPFVQIDSSGTFRLEGMVPGVYRFSAPIRGIRAPLGSWWLKSIVVSGREVLDAPLDLRQSSEDAVVTFSDRASTVAGMVKDAQGAVVPDAWAIVFSTERAAWFFNSRRVAGVKTEVDGRYTIRNLPPGDYYVAAATDVAQGEWFDHDVLQKLVPSAIRIALGEHEDKKQDVVIR